MGENHFGITDSGRQRDNNEDRFIAQPVFNKHCILACVIDGVGGYAGGEVAAQVTRDTIIQHLRKRPANLLPAMNRALDLANERIFKEKEANPQNEKMACVVTLAVVDLEQNKFWFAHVGDTRLYLFRDSSLVKITNDHSAVGFLEETGRITEEAAMQHPKRNEVNKALGYESNNPLAKDFVDTGESPFLPGDIMLICSDGLTDMISSAKIIGVLSSNNTLKQRASQLIDAANAAGGKDNVTVVLVQNNKLPAKHAITRPVITNRTETHSHHPVHLADGNIQATATLSDEVTETPKRGNGLLKVLIMLCIVFLAGFAWFFYKSQQNKIPKLIMPPANQQQPDSINRSLQDSINSHSQNKIILLDPARTILVSDALLIDQDSFHIKGQGVTLVGDSIYPGPAFRLSEKARYVLLDSITFSNFDVAIVVNNKGLHLNNVQFKNCRVPVQFENKLPQNILVSGAQAETLFYHKDSLQK